MQTTLIGIYNWIICIGSQLANQSISLSLSVYKNRHQERAMSVNFVLLLQYHIFRGLFIIWAAMMSSTITAVRFVAAILLIGKWRSTRFIIISMMKLFFFVHWLHWMFTFRNITRRTFVKRKPTIVKVRLVVEFFIYERISFHPEMFFFSLVKGF